MEYVSIQTGKKSIIVLSYHLGDIWPAANAGNNSDLHLKSNIVEAHYQNIRPMSEFVKVTTVWPQMSVLW